jgi:hypothetical protein
MKKGKTCKIQGFKKMKAVYGTVDSVDFKSVYLNIQTWVLPIKHSLNWSRVVLNMSREIKHLIYETLDNNMVKENFIVDLDLRASGIVAAKKSFLNLEINFYLKEEMDFKSEKLKSYMKTISKEISTHIFSKNEYFTFSLKKQPKEKIAQTDKL